MISELYNPNRDQSCVECGYNLRGLSLNSSCPECGCSIQESVAFKGVAVTNPRWFVLMAAGTVFLSLFLLTRICVGEHGLILRTAWDMSKSQVSIYLTVELARDISGLLAVFLLTRVGLKKQSIIFGQTCRIVVCGMYIMVVVGDWIGSSVVNALTSNPQIWLIHWWVIDIISFAILLIELGILTDAMIRFKRIPTTVLIVVLSVLLIGATIELWGYRIGEEMNALANLRHADLSSPSTFDFATGQNYLYFFRFGSSEWTFLIPHICVAVMLVWLTWVFMQEKRKWHAARSILSSNTMLG